MRAARAAERAVSGPAGARDRDDVGRELEQPGERDLGRRRVVRAGDLGERLVAAPRPPARRGPPSGECAITRDARLVAALDDAAAERAVVEQAQRDLDGGDRRELERLVELRAVDVRRRRRARRGPRRASRASARTDGPPRRPRIGRMEEVEVDREPVERREARLAVGADRLRAAVRHPGAVRPRHAALRHDPGARRARAERSREQELARCPSYARAVSKTVIPASAAAAIVSARARRVRQSRMQPSPMRSSSSRSQGIRACRRRAGTPRAARPRARPRDAPCAEGERTGRAARDRFRPSTVPRRSRRRETSRPRLRCAR